VVGLPLQLDGSRGDMALAVHQFVEELGIYGLPIDTVDERHSSQEAETTLKNARQTGSHGRIRKDQIDAAAAVLIAERYLSKN
jgi:putative transcription antitermination factor YqgF